MTKIKFKFNSLLIIFSIAILLFCTQSVLAHIIIPFDKQENSSTKVISAVPAIIAQKNLDNVKIEVYAVKNLYMLKGEGGNMLAYVGNDGIILIDSQLPSLSEKITEAMAKITRQPIRYLINTHYHFDHTGGNENFAKNGAMIIAHDNVIKQMKVPHTYEVLGMNIPVSSNQALPRITFNDQTSLNLNDNPINAFHVPPAHTDGDIVIHFPQQNLIHTGDLFFNGMYPFIDTGVGGSVQGMIKAIDKILLLCDDQSIIIPGHGEIASPKDLMAFQDMLKTVNERVKEGITKNMTLSDLIEAKTLADLDETWGKGFLNSNQFLTIAYNGLSQK
ncbi:MBL fold metallo-hydrolase [Geminocystis sp. NIES-3708]|uniref:MBL fold metallo-hydrolase n=1 Tax=Geminocystis sp. NIES-3708 TaxID=1615909 RepID=UPI00082E8225|nr:MBL fold metallo-hydrolase [Geminocystis sp. NIES-3708]